MTLSAIINFCSNDYRCLNACIAGVRGTASQILIAVCDHFFDGSPENFALLQHCYLDHPDCLFLEYAYDPEEVYGSRASSSFTPRQKVRQWHNTGRLIGFFHLAEKTSHVLFLDADEVAEREAFQQWWQSFDPKAHTTLRFGSYWYFREAQFCDEQFRDTALLVKRETLHPDLFFEENERKGLYDLLPAPKQKGVLNSSGKPLFHHFSWVKTKEEMLQKTRSWGHRFDFADWEERIEKMLATPFTGTDFGGETRYSEKPIFFDPLTVAVPEVPSISFAEHLQMLPHFPNVRRLSRKDVYALDLKLRFAL